MGFGSGPGGDEGIETRTRAASQYNEGETPLLVAVTGGTGFIGSHTVRALVAAGHRVRLLVRDPRKMKRIYDPLGIEIADFVEGDATDPDRVAALLSGCDGLVHAAALVALEASRAHEVKHNNEQSVQLVIGGAVGRGVRRIVYVSSTGALLPEPGRILTEEAPIARGQNAYGQSKAFGERYVRELQAEGAPILTSYPTAVIGPDDPGLTDPNRAASFFVRFGALITSGGYQPVDVRDLAALHVAMLESDLPNGRFLASGPYQAWPELYARIERLTGRRLPRYPVPGAVLRGLGSLLDGLRRFARFELPIPITREAMEYGTRWPVADGSRAMRELGVDYRDLDQTLADTYRWLAAAGHLDASDIGRLAPPGA
jgi:nucleoside-diphosphate-sugar epimerase